MVNRPENNDETAAILERGECYGKAVTDLNSFELSYTLKLLSRQLGQI